MKYRMKDLENFSLAAGCITLGEAARLLNISQPALTESIQRLEFDLGSAVFYRSRTGIQLTPRGRQFLTKVKSLLLSVEELELDTDKRSVFAGQSISIGCHIAVAGYTLPYALKELQKQAPDFKIELTHDLSRNIQAQVQKGKIDIGIVINPIQVPDLIITKMASDKVSLWRAPGVDLLDTLIYNSQLVQSQAILKKWKDRPSKTIETDSLEIICRLTAKGLGYGIIPARAVELYKENLHPIKSLPSFMDEISVVYRPEFGRSVPEKVLLNCIRSVFK